ncbi:hypothetical protein M2401_000810 [Pseudomonas sp. JUb42]|uniref:phage minor head protein n=1 Tax=Pseudomonas sp. JUb42 TaxID=2940611 RepID=UPI002169BE17|nr:phage minor head protein [Pseudomonas sp. JUb42]MCS3467089.1 hypothetical protein [Pseudomonas sp. JUb42]
MKAVDVERDIESLEPAAQQDYLDQVAAVAQSVSIAALEQAVADNDQSRILELLALGLLLNLTVRLRTTYTTGATKELAGIKIPGMRPELDMNGQEVNSFLSAQAIAIREQAALEQALAISVALTEGRAAGLGARSIALNLAGRLSKQTGRRVGGMIGVSGTAAEAIEKARLQLGSGDPAMLKAYLQRIARDRRFDGAVQAAILGGEPVPKEVLDKALGAYAEKLLAVQAQTIAQTAVAEAYNKGREEGWKQLTDRSNGLYTYIKTWRTRMDGKERRTHGAMNGQKVEKDQPFHSPSGAMLMFPCDSSLGAPLSERARCRCVAEYSLKKNVQAVQQ